MDHISNLLARSVDRRGEAPLLDDATLQSLYGRDLPPASRFGIPARICRALATLGLGARMADHGADPRTRLGDPHAVHEERVAAAPRARRRSLDGRVREEAGRGRGAVAGVRTPAPPPLPDASHA